MQKYHEDYTASDVNETFLPTILSTPGRREFLRLYSLAHRQTVKFFDTFKEEPSNAAFTFHRAVYLFHIRAAICPACALANALRRHVAPHTDRRFPHQPPPRVPHDSFSSLPTLLAVPEISSLALITLLLRVILGET